MNLQLIKVMALVLLVGCASKEDIYYMQDAGDKAVGNIVYDTSQIQPNDILKIL